MSTVNIKKKEVVEVEIEGMLYTEEEAREIYEALRDHFEKVNAPSADNTALKDILERIEEDEKNSWKKVPPYHPPWPFPTKPEDIIPEWYINPLQKKL